ncbi:DUF6079 family protein [Proteiniborus sp.]|uniref:DUF6079 family protein n=1 Tax=Proteiniborus sp. TaxID=2079015 RepID=UPI00331CF192
MKYSELINFNPIETVIELKSAGSKDKAINLVESYVISNEMAEKLDAGLISQIQLEEVVDNKGVLIVGNYGTGKSHLMSVISSVANDENYLKYIRNKEFSKYLEPIAGKFEVLRIELGAVDNSLRNIITKEIEDDLSKRGINYKFPHSSTLTNNKGALEAMMSSFEAKYPNKGYLIVIDELLDYLKTRREQEIMLDLGFLREIGEFIKNSRLRIISGVQEQLFSNPTFSFVSDTMSKIKDRFEQVIIRKKDTAFVVSERILSKTPEQKAKIREHILPYCVLYKEMSERIEDYVELFPIHPAYIDVFNKVHIAENRHVLKTISTTVNSILDKDVPDNAPGIISYDTYWSFIKDNYARRSDQEIREVLEKSEILEEKIAKTFPKQQYKGLALKIIYALSVHRLTTGGIDVRLGLTAENLKDDLCLYIENLPEKDPEFLLSIIKVVLKDIMVLVSGQFIEYNKENQQYFLDLKKDIDYDAKIEDKANFLEDISLNKYYYSIVYDLLDWDEEKAVPSYEIYEYQLNWDSHNVYRRGYLFLGIPNERSTAQPPRDYYMYVLPPFGNVEYTDELKEDEVFFELKLDEEFYNNLKLYSASKELLNLASDQNTKNIYSKKAAAYEKNLKQWLNENKNTFYNVIYKGVKQQLIQLTHGLTRQTNFKDTIDKAASICLEEYFIGMYPDFPVFKVKITKHNQAELMLRAIKHFAGQKASDSTAILESFGLIKNGNIDLENSKYAMELVKKMKTLPPQGVLNRIDILEDKYDETLDKRFKINNEYYIVVLLALVYSGYANLALGDTVLTASNLEKLLTLGNSHIHEFKYLAKPKEASIVELKRLLKILGLPTGMTVNNRELEKGLDRILARTREVAEQALKYKTYINKEPVLWGEALIPEHIKKIYELKISQVLNEFGNFRNRYNTVAKLSNLNLTFDQLDEIEEGMNYMAIVSEYEIFKANSDALVSYIANVENSEIPDDLRDKIDKGKAQFFRIRDNIREGINGEAAATKLKSILTPIKEEYIEYYFDKHNKARLGHSESKKKGQIMSSRLLSNLKKLTEIKDISQKNKLDNLEKQLSSLQTCFELSTSDLQKSHICNKCRFTLSETNPTVTGMLESIENNLEKLLEDWTKALLLALEDNLIMENKSLLKPEQQKLVDNVIKEKALPEEIDGFFVNTFNTLFQGLDKLNIDMWEMMDEIQNLGPSTVNDLKNKLLTYIDEKVKGKDLNKVRIIITYDSDKKKDFIIAENNNGEENVL